MMWRSRGYGPPCRMTAFQAEFGSGVVWSQAVKSGKVSGRVKR